MRPSMRIAVALLAGLIASTPASAGLHVVYLDMEKAKQLQIDVADNGDARIAEVGSPDYGLLLNGEFYVIDVQDGHATVARIRDVATAIDAVLPPIFKGLFDKPGNIPPSERLKIEPGEAGSAGGRDGRVYHVRGFDDLTPDKVTDYLISSDPDLKPVGIALEQFMNAAIVPAAPLLGASARDLIQETRSIFALGTPIDIGGRFRLNLAGKAAIPAGVFRLPAAPLTVAALTQAMKASMEKKPGADAPQAATPGQ